MPWFLAGLYSCLCLCVLTSGISLPPIHWNASNPMFKPSNNDRRIEVHLYDDIDFICPHYPGVVDRNRLEFYRIYQVTKREYDECYLNSSYTPVTVLECDNPAGERHRRFTIIFEPFSAIPNVPEYHYGGTYYFITTSTGTEPGLSNDHQGACLYRNMKLTIKVCCDSTTTTTTKATTTPFHRPTTKHQKPIYPTDKPPGSKDKTTQKKHENETKPSHPDYNKGRINGTRSIHTSVSWTLYSLAVYVFLLRR